MAEFLPLSDLVVYWFSFETARYSSRYVAAFKAAQYLSDSGNFPVSCLLDEDCTALFQPLSDCGLDLAGVRPSVYFADPRPRVLPVAVVTDGLPLWVRLPRSKSLTACEALLVHLYILRSSFTYRFPDCCPRWVIDAVSRAWIPTEAPVM